MADPTYHHSQRTKFTLAEVEAAVGKRATLVLEGTIIKARQTDAGSMVVFEPDERFGFGEIALGGDLELFDVEGSQ